MTTYIFVLALLPSFDIHLQSREVCYVCMKSKVYTFFFFLIFILCFLQSLFVRSGLNKTEAANVSRGFLF